VPGPGSKSTVPLKVPVVYTFPEASTAIDLPWSWAPAPICLAHFKVWALVDFAANISPTERKISFFNFLIVFQYVIINDF
jgi:hypothetical protein